MTDEELIREAREKNKMLIFAKLEVYNIEKCADYPDGKIIFIEYPDFCRIRKDIMKKAFQLFT